MRDPKRIKKMLKELETLWNQYPDQRLGQILENYVFFAGDRGDKTSVQLFYQEDDDTLKILEKNNKQGKEIIYLFTELRKLSRQVEKIVITYK